MKVRMTESQYNLVRALKEENSTEPSTVYVAKFEIIFNASNDNIAKSELAKMHSQVSDATRNAEVYPSLYQKVPFGGEPKRIA